MQLTFSRLESFAGEGGGVWVSLLDLLLPQPNLGSEGDNGWIDIPNPMGGGGHIECCSSALGM